MSIRRRLTARNVFLALGLLTAAGWVAPQFFSAERYRGRVQAGLERALGRSATFGAISFHLIPRPGFTLDNVTIGEDPAFGVEPFARVDRMDCDIRLRGLIPWRLDILRLSLERPSFNLVRNADGNWNFEGLLGREGSGTARPSGAGVRSFHLDASEARVNFKLGDTKIPFAVTGVEGSLDFDRVARIVKFQWTGNPVRTDLTLPTPGELVFEGRWEPAAGRKKALDATLSTESAMLYDWIPVLTGHNPEIYAVMDASAHLTGSLDGISAEGRIRLSQLHRWGQAPPSSAMDSEIYFRGKYDRVKSRLSLESVDASFADSHVHLTGSVEDLRTLPALDLVIAIERSRLEDFHALAGRFTPRLADWSASGRVDALMTVQGPWTERRYGGFVDIRDVGLRTPAGNYPISEITLRINRSGVQLAPVTVELAPHVNLVADGQIERGKPEKLSQPKLRKQGLVGQAPVLYTLTLAANSVPLSELLSFARGVGVKVAASVDARGEASAAFTLNGSAWPLSEPSIAGLVDVHAARIFIPGLTEPLNLPRARIQVLDRRITVAPLVAVLGTSVFTGRLEHDGDLRQPWKFDLRANALQLEQGARWFDVLGNRRPLSILARLPGLRSLVKRRSAASSLFTALHASGRFATPKLTYRDVTLSDFRSDVEIRDRVARVTGATFKAGGGKGTAKLAVDFTQSPVQLTVEAAIADARLQPLAPYLPTAVRKLRGSYSAGGHFVSLGLSRQEIASNLQGQVELRLKNLNLGDFDPVAAMARASHQTFLEPARAGATMRQADLVLQVNDRRVTVSSAPVAISGAWVRLRGTCGFDGVADLNVVAGYRGPGRLPVPEEEAVPRTQTLRVRLSGPLNKLVTAPVQETSRALPARP